MLRFASRRSALESASMERRQEMVPRRYDYETRAAASPRSTFHFKRRRERRCKIPAAQISASPNSLTLGIPSAILGGSCRAPLSSHGASTGTRGRSSVGRALEWHSRGQGFDSPRLHGVATVVRRTPRRCCSKACRGTWPVIGSRSGRVGFRELHHIAGIAQLVEHNLAKVGVAGSSPVSRSRHSGVEVRGLRVGVRRPCAAFFELHIKFRPGALRTGFSSTLNPRPCRSGG
jgi:hypothetical protein